jgi:hypothetical protein
MTPYLIYYESCVFTNKHYQAINDDSSDAQWVKTRTRRFSHQSKHVPIQDFNSSSSFIACQERAAREVMFKHNGGYQI